MFVSLLKNYWSYIAVCAASILLTIAFSPEKIKIEEKTVEVVKERVRVDTRIIERPDGTTETIISERRDTDTRSETEKLTTGLPVWSVSLSASAYSASRDEPIYGVGVQKRLVGSLSGGIYARTDKEVGVMLSYSF